MTIAHQDDRYEKRYAETLFSMYEKYPDMTVFCSDYATLRMERETEAPKLQLVNAVWLVKKLLRLPLRFKGLSDRKQSSGRRFYSATPSAVRPARTINS